MNDIEIWKEYNGSIEVLHRWIKVSNLGRIYKIGGKTSSSKILKGAKNNQGYMRLHVSINNKVYNFAIHRLIAEMFCENTYNKPYVDHINANRSDNRACNLRWVTSSENNSNPLYIEKLSNRLRHQLSEHNHLSEINKKQCYAQNKNGEILKFDSIQELQKYFNTKANISRKLKTGDYFKSKKSNLCGWKVGLL